MPIHVILSAGHRNDTGGGAPGEPALNLRYCSVYADVLTAAGIMVHYIQRLDGAGDGKPDFFSGKLDAVAAKVVSVANALPDDDPAIMLDVHMEYPAAVGGMFAIIPDGAKLGGTDADKKDSWEHNKKSRDLGSKIVQRMSAATGIPVRSSTAPGLMSERVTGVGEKGARLAMFRGTAPLRERLVRLILEHGNMKVDAALLNASTTPQKCAEALRDVLLAEYGHDAAPAFAPHEFATRMAPPPLDGDDHVVNDRRFIAIRRRVEIAENGVPALQFADADAPAVREPFRAGEEIEVAFMVRSAAEPPDDWRWVAVDGTRIPMSGTVQKFRAD